jgi:di- and tripeptidase
MFLKRTFTQLGATSSLLPGASGKNPLVLATFKGKEPDGARPKKKRVLFYGSSYLCLCLSKVSNLSSCSR